MHSSSGLPAISPTFLTSVAICEGCPGNGQPPLEICLVDKAALIKPYKVLASLHLLIAFDAKVVLHGGRVGRGVGVDGFMGREAGGLGRGWCWVWVVGVVGGGVAVGRQGLTPWTQRD